MIVRAPLRGWTTPVALAVILSVLSAVSAQAAPVTIAWDPSPDQTVIGYQVYVGTSSGSYTETFDVGLATSFTYSPRDESVYYFAVASYATGPQLGPLSSEVSTSSKANNPVNSAPNSGNEAETYWSSLWAARAEAMRSLTQNIAPTVTITVPTSGGSYSTDQAFVVLGGSASDDGIVTEVTWTTDRGHSGRATGTENWIAGVPLQRGTNTITIRARDDYGRISSHAIVVTFAPERSATQQPLSSR